jgi:hypothetical protein
MKNKLTVSELMNYVYKICPNATVHSEDDGNIVISTNLCETVNSHGLVDMDTGKYAKSLV